MSKTSIPEAIRAIQDDEPTRLSLVDRSFRRDVETIVLKAMEKDRGRRYRTAIKFAEDLQRFLRREPVEAVATILEDAHIETVYAAIGNRYGLLGKVFNFFSKLRGGAKRNVGLELRAA